MSAPVIAGDVSLHILDDEGILFAESRQELHSTNTAATFLWCLIEDAFPIDRIIAAYASTFALDEDEARRHVSPILRRWFGLGHISAPDLPDESVTPLAAGLTFLLTNDELRRSFRESPQTVARTLAIERDDLEAFVALDPDALDQQALEIDEQRRRQRFAPVGTCSLDATELLAAAARAASDARVERRRYRLIDTIFTVTMPGPVAARAIPVLQHLEVANASNTDVDLHVRGAETGYIIFDGMLPLHACEGLHTVVPSLKLLLRQLAVGRHRYFMEIHAGVVALGDVAVLLPGASGRGKTTLTAALAHSVGRYFSDEIALLEDPSLDVRPLPLTMTIKPGSVEPLQHLYPQLPTLDEHLREDRQPVRYLPPPSGSRRAVDEPARPVRWIVFPSYELDCDTALTPLSRAHGFRRLLDESLVLPDALDRRRVERLVAWARRIEFHELRFSSLDAAVSAIRGLSRRI